MLINADNHIGAGEVRSLRCVESDALKSNAAGRVRTAGKLRTQNLIKVLRSVDIKNIVVRRNHGIGLIETFNVAVNFSVCFFHSINAVFEEPDRKLALDRAPHPLNAALCLRRPRQDLMDIKLFTNALKLRALFMHNLEFFPGSQILATRRVTEDSSAIRINLPRDPVGIAGLTQDLKVAIEAFVLSNVKAGDFPGRVVNATGETIALNIAELIEPGIRRAVHLHKVAFTIAPEPEPMNNLFLFSVVSLRRDQAVLLHDFSQSSKRDVDTFEVRQAAAEVGKIDIGIMARIQQRDPLRQSRVCFVFWNASPVPVFKQSVPQQRILLF